MDYEDFRNPENEVWEGFDNEKEEVEEVIENEEAIEKPLSETMRSGGLISRLLTISHTWSDMIMEIKDKL